MWSTNVRSVHLNWKSFCVQKSNCVVTHFLEGNMSHFPSIKESISSYLILSQMVSRKWENNQRDAKNLQISIFEFRTIKSRNMLLGAKWIFQKRHDWFSLDLIKVKKVKLSCRVIFSSVHMKCLVVIKYLNWLEHFGGELYVCMGESIKVDGLIERRLLLWIERDYWINNSYGEYWICRKVL